jgi:hypothetical protein
MNKKLNISLLGLLCCAILPSSLLAQQPLTEEKLWEMGMIGTPVVHPNAQTAVYSVRYTKLEENKGQNDLYIIDLKTKQSKQVLPAHTKSRLSCAGRY